MCIRDRGKYNVMVLADEIYGDLVYLPTKSISTYIPHLTIRGSSVSKNLGCGGYRLGWITFPRELTGFFGKCHSIASSLYSCTTAHIQYATAELFDKQDVMNRIFNNTKFIFEIVIRDICEIFNTSKCHNMIQYVYPQAAWYLFLNFDKYEDKLAQRNINTSVELQEFLLEHFGIATVAGEKFNVGGLNLRFSLVDISGFNYETNPHGDIAIKMKKGLKLLIHFFEKL